jgi:hydrogenase maturation protein HypF
MSGDDSSNPPALPLRRVAVTVQGIVQGVGFRPFVYKQARAESLSGWVRNDSGTVSIELQGQPAAIERFLASLRDRGPPQAQIDQLDVHELLPAVGEMDFAISHSRDQASPRPGLPADLATCSDCLQEIFDPGQRRFRYPFTNCTNCGPRWSIIERVPYDRAHTSMRAFAMCAACRGEYEDPADRRFHAQPIACPACGPQLQLLDNQGRQVADREDALQAALAALTAGKVLALKGMGGFQLIADATNPLAVASLRQRKRRPHKPLAVMMANLSQVRCYCELSEREAEVLSSPAAPILLLRLRPGDPAPNALSADVAPGNPYLGVMLPYTPLHHLIAADFARPIICTSGNLSEEPMVISTTDAIQRLGAIADLILTHDRPIVRPVDDSVGRVDEDQLQLFRRARGYAPLPLKISGADLPVVLAVGGHLKNTVAISLGREVVISPHIGDLDNALGVEVHRRAIDDLLSFFAVTPQLVACDLHPDYASTRHAQQLAARWGVPLIPVQHHHAHIAAGMAEHVLDGPVLGFSWDGTGYGTDATAWGGEILLCQGAGFRRVAHLRTFQLPGGDAAAREPRRAALGVLYEMLGDAAGELASPWFRAAELRVLLAALARGTLFPRTSSLGRLFDAVAAICGAPDRVSFEGQAAMGLEFAADLGVDEAYPLPLGLVSGTPAVADWEPLVRAVLDDRRHGVPVSRIAAQFHNALAELAVAAARLTDCSTIVLSGGCFQNALLSQRLRQRLSEAGFHVYTQQSVPSGDGGIVLGQIWIAAKIHEEARHVSGDTR